MNKNNDLSQLFFFFVVLVFLIFVFFVTPSLQLISLLTVLNVLFLTPLVKNLHRKGLDRTLSIFLVFVGAGLIVGLLVNWGSRIAINQFSAILQAIPGLTSKLLAKIQEIELSLKQHFNLELEFGITNLLAQAGSSSSNWLIYRATSLLSGMASATLMVPIFSFFILKDGPTYGKELLKLVPQKYYSEIVLTIGKTSKSLGKFLRAKALEAFLVSLLTYIGLLVCGAEYAPILALIAGITNILPYIGPVLGYIPAVALLGFGWPVFLVFLIVNMIDMLIIFPIMIGKLVNLSPLSLLVAVAVGQELYGLVGMLVSVPVASSIKIIFQEVINVLYAEKINSDQTSS